MVDIPPPPPTVIVEADKTNADIRQRINLVRVTFAKARVGAQQTGENRPQRTAQFDNFNQALPFQNFNEFHNFNDFSNFNDFHNFNDFGNNN